MKATKRALALFLALCMMLADGTALAAVLKLPSMLTRIEEEAFYGSTSLDEVIVPEGVTYIGPRAFSESTVSVISLPRSVTEIAQDAFEGCEDAVAKVYYGSFAHEWCEENDLPYVLADVFIVADNGDGTATLTKYTGSDLEVIVPETVRGLTLTAIGEEAFYASSATSIVLPSTIREIHDLAFLACQNLQSLTLNEGLVRIGDEAFTYCESLLSLHIPSTVQNIHPQAFAYYTGIQNFTVEVGNAFYTAQNGVLFNAEKNHLAVYPGGRTDRAYSVPAGVTSIGRSAFSMNPHLESVSLPDGLLTIDEWAFDSCMSLAQINLPSSITFIGQGAFGGCGNLEAEVEKGSYAAMWCLRNGVSIKGGYVSDSPFICEYRSNGTAVIIGYTGTEKDIVIPDQIDGCMVAFIGEGAFTGMDITSVVLPSTIGGIHANAFRDCKNLRSITLNEGLTAIYANAFSGCESLTSLHLPSSLYHIENSAFMGCSSLQQFSISEDNWEFTVKDGVLFYWDDLLCYPAAKTQTTYVLPEETYNILDHAFYDNQYLQHVVLNEELSYIGKEAFAECLKLESINLHSQLYTIGTDAFRNCTRLTADVAFDSYAYVWCMQNGINVSCEIPDVPEFTYQVNTDGTITITKCYGYDKHVTVPEKIDGKTVTAIGSYGLSRPLMSSVELPDTLKRIEDYAFYNTEITGIDIPESVEFIGNGAFAECSCIESVVLPEGLTEIKDYTFDGCSSLSFVKIPDSVTHIGYSAFSYSKITTVDLPKNLESIEGDAFYSCRKLTSIVLPEGLTSIQDYTFSNCEKLTSITIPDSVTSIGYEAFGYCNALKEIKLPKNLKSIDECAFYYCYNLHSIQLPEGVKTIGYGAFGECTGLTYIYLPESLTSIDDDVFEYCKENVTAIVVKDSYAYEWCVENDVNYLFDLPDTPQDGSSFVWQENEDGETCTITGYTGTEKNVVIPETLGGLKVTDIGENAFSGLDITSVTLSSNVSSIRQSAFENCVHLQSVVLNEGLYEIEALAFAGCSSLTSVHIPSSTASISSRSFYRCTSLQQFTVESGNETYAAIDGVLMSSDVLVLTCYPAGKTASSYTVPEGICCVRSYAFAYNPYLQQITLPISMNYIETSAFENCSALTSINLPEHVCEIGNNTFFGCEHVEVDAMPGTFAYMWCVQHGIALKGNAEDIPEFSYQQNSDGSITITSYNGADAVVEVPSEIDGKTVSAIGESVFAGLLVSSVTLPETITSIGKEAFRHTAITSMVVPQNVKSIGEEAFAACEQLESLVLPSGLTTIEEGAFRGCRALTSLQLPASVLTIDSWAFSNCSGLTALTLPNQLQSIGSSAFAWCENLTEVEIPDSVTEMGDGAFYGCYALRSICIPGSVKKIAVETFLSSGLESAVLCEGVESIDMFAFGYTPLNSIQLPASLKNIGEDPFVSCPETLVASVIEDSYAHEWCVKNGVNYVFTVPDAPPASEGITCVSNGDGTCTVTGYTGTDTDVIIPGTINGMTVTAIGDQAFANNMNITSMVLPDSVETIGANAFCMCAAMKSIHLPANLKTIESNAFLLCVELESIDLPEGLTTIGYCGFTNCQKIKTVTLPSSLENFDATVFGLCYELEEILVADGINGYTSVDGVLFNEDQTVLLCYPMGKEGSYTIPSGVTTIGENSFKAYSGMDITFPDSVTTIEFYAFSGMRNVKSVVLPEGLKRIEAQAFDYCRQLTSVYLPESLSYIGYDIFVDCPEELVITVVEGSYAHEWCVENEIAFIFAGPSATPAEYFTWEPNNDGVSCTITSYTGEDEEVIIPKTLGGRTVGKIGYGAFADNVQLISVTMPDTVTEISSSAFSDCKNLKTIGMSANLKVIGSFAFHSCYALESLHIPAGVTQFGIDRMYNCASMAEFTVAEGSKSFAAVDGVLYTADKSSLVVFPGAKSGRHVMDSNARTITPGAFQGHQQIEELVLSSKLTAGTIDPRLTFQGCESLKSITIPEGNAAYSSENGMLYSADKSIFIKCPEGKTGEVTLNSAVRTIGEYALNECMNVTAVQLPNQLKHIGQEAFGYCTGLTEITIPNSVETIADKAFNYCYALKSVQLSESLVSIKEKAFAFCKLESVVIPDGTAEIGAGAFYYNSKLASVTLPASLHTIADDAFDYCSNNLIATVIKNSYAHNWCVQNNIACNPVYGEMTVSLIPADRIVVNEIPYGVKMNVTKADGSFTAFINDELTDWNEVYTFNQPLHLYDPDTGKDWYENSAINFGMMIDEPEGAAYVACFPGSWTDDESLLDFITSVEMDSVDFIIPSWHREIVTFENGAATMINVTPEEGATIYAIAWADENGEIFLVEKVEMLFEHTNPYGTYPVSEVLIPAENLQANVNGASGVRSTVANGQITNLVTSVNANVINRIVAPEGAVFYTLHDDFRHPWDPKTTLGEDRCIPIQMEGFQQGVNEVTIRKMVCWYNEDYQFMGGGWVTMTNQYVDPASMVMTVPVSRIDMSPIPFGMAMELSVEDGSIYAMIDDGATDWSNVVTFNEAAAVTDSATGETRYENNAVMFGMNIQPPEGAEMYSCAAGVWYSDAALIRELQSLIVLPVEAKPLGWSRIIAEIDGQTVTTIPWTRYEGETMYAVAWYDENGEIMLVEKVQMVLDHTNPYGEYTAKEVLIPAQNLMANVNGQSYVTSTVSDGEITNVFTSSWPQILDYIVAPDGTASYSMHENFRQQGADKYGLAEGRYVPMELVGWQEGKTEQSSRYLLCWYDDDGMLTGGGWVTLTSVYEAGTSADDFTWVDNGDGTVRITGYIGENPSVIVPAQINGMTVTTVRLTGNTLITSVVLPDTLNLIASEAFMDCTSLRSVTLPDTIASIEVGAFENCTALTSIDLPESVSYLGHSAFRCSGLTSISLPEGIRIYEYAFYDCNGLTEVVLPKNADVKTYAFAECSGLVSFTFGEGMYAISRAVLENCEKLSSVSIPSSMWQIYDRAFLGCSSLETISLPEGLERIGSEVFMDCTKLSSIELPQSLELIGGYAFRNCTSLRQLTLPDALLNLTYGMFEGSGLTSMVIPEHINNLPNRLFEDCVHLQTVSIPDGVTTIGEYVFENCTSLADVKLPSQLNSIGSYAFQKCTQLTQIALPGGVTSIGSYAFADCKGVRAITLPEGLSSIGYGAFQNISGVSALTLPSTLTSLGGGVFSGMTALEQMVIPNTITRLSGATFKGCTSLVSVTLPQTLTEIGYSEFENCSALTAVSIPQSVKKIGNSAFSRCTSLASVTLPDEMESLGTLVFLGCTSLTDVRVPDGLSTLQLSTFNGCTKLANVTLPDSLTSIGGYVFQNCTALKEIALPDGLLSLGDGAFRLCTGLTAMKLPEGMQTIGTVAFEGCSGLASINLPVTITFIGAGAFHSCPNLICYVEDNSYAHSYCVDNGLRWQLSTTPEEFFVSYNNGDGTCAITGYTGDEPVVVVPRTIGGLTVVSAKFTGNTLLTSVTFPNTIQTITAEALRGCTRLEEVIIREGTAAIGDNAFRQCTALTGVKLPSTLKSFGAYAFSGCTALQQVKLPAGVTTIGNYAFHDCYALAEISLPDSVTSIGSNAFYACPIPAVDIPANAVIGQNAFARCGSLSSVQFGANVTIGNRAFQYCTALTQVELPQDLKSIGEYAFAGTGLTSVVVPSFVKTLPAYVFENCKSLESIQLPASLTAIGNYALNGCTALASIDLPSTLTTLGDSALSGCKNITSLTLPDGLTSMGTYAISGLSVTEITIPSRITTLSNGLCFGSQLLQKVNLPSGVRAIGSYAFQDCKALAQIDISRVTSIGKRAFENCSSLKAVTLSSSITVLDEEVFENSGLTSLTLPANLKTISDNALRGTAIETLVIPSTVTSIGRYAFEGMKNLRELTIPSGVSKVSDYMMQGCTSLTAVRLPERLAYIGTNAFYGCEALESITIPSTVTSIGNDAFYQCASLTDITLPAGVKTIGSYAFAFTGISSFTFPAGLAEMPSGLLSNCKNLTEVIIPEGVAKMGVSVLRYCTSLQSVQLPESLTSLGYYAFFGSGITSINLPENLTSIGNECFYNCESLRNIYIPASVTSIGSMCFSSYKNLTVTVYENSYAHRYFRNSGCTLNLIVPLTFTYTDNGDGTCAVNGCAGNETDIVVPETIDGLTVTSAAFTGNSSITSVSFPATMTALPDSALRECTSLTKVVLPDTVTSIGSYALSNCTSLTQINLPAGLQHIGDYAFERTIALPELNLPQTLTSIGNSVFSNSGLTSFTFPQGIEKVPSYLLDCCTKLQSVIIPEGVTSIGAAALRYCTSLTSLILPESLKTISQECFNQCSNLQSLYIPASVSGITGSAFTNLHPDVVITVHHNSPAHLYLSRNTTLTLNVLAPYDTADNADGTLTITRYTGNEADVVVPGAIGGKTVTAIGQGAFNDAGIASITLPDSLIRMDTGAIMGCGIAEITLPASLVQYSGYSIVRCTGLTAIHVAQGNPAFSSVNGVLLSADGGLLVQLPTGYQGEFTVPGGVHTIGRAAFHFTGGLTSLILPEGVNTILDDAFYEFGFTQITAPMSLNAVDEMAFIGNTAQVTAHVPDASYAQNWFGTHGFAVETGGSASFTWADNDDGATCTITGYTGTATDVIIPSAIDGKTVTSIASAAFDGYETEVLLTSVVIPEGVTHLGEGAFYGQEEMTSVTLPQTLRTMDGYVFGDCYSLQSIAIPEGVEEIAEGTFNSCESLTDVSLPSTVYTIGLAAFGGCDALTSITLPQGMTSIGSNAFANCAALEEVIVPETLLSVGESAFYKCTALQTIALPDTVKNIGKFAFQQSGLTAFTIPANVTLIHDSAFKSCQNLATVTIPGTVLEIDRYAFSSCSALETVVVEQGVQFIREYAFGGCDSLQSITLPESLTYISDYAFDMSYSVLPIVPAGSYACDWCVNMGWMYELIATEEAFFAVNDNGDGTVAVASCSSTDSAIVIPASIGGAEVTSIAAGAFSGSAAAAIHLPDTVIELDLDAFDGASALTAIQVSEDHPVFSTVDGMLMDKDQTILLRCPEGLLGTAV